MARRDIVVIGASAGGLEPLLECVRALPANLPAAVFIVLHVAAGAPSALPGIVARHTALPVLVPSDRTPVTQGHIAVPPGDRHMMLEDGVIRVEAGPRVHGFRPAVDPLFASAAAAYGPRVIGLVLSGSLSDGVAGMAAIRRGGGIAMVQDPQDALFPDMPRHVLEESGADYVLPSSEIGQRLVELVGEEAPERPAAAPSSLEAGAEIRRAFKQQEQGGRDGEPSVYSCPDCGGVLWEVDGPPVQYVCHVGHRYSVEGLVRGQADALEEALWSAMRAMREQASLNRRMAARIAQRSPKSRLPRQFEQRAVEAERHVATIRQIIDDAFGETPIGSTVVDDNELLLGDARSE